MLPKFTMDCARHLVSAMLPDDEPCALKVGSEIRLTRDFDLGQGITLLQGDEGIVTFAGFYAIGRTWVEVLLYKLHKGLREDDNKIVLEPFGTEDIISCLTVL